MIMMTLGFIWIIINILAELEDKDQRRRELKVLDVCQPVCLSDV